MATLPRATQRRSATAGASSAGAMYCVILAAVATAADSTPRVYSNHGAIYTKHGYSEGLRYAALHIAETGLPVIFVGLPIATAGTVGRLNTSGNSGSSVVSVAAGSSGPLCETDGIVKVVTGGTVGTDQIVLSLSCDGGRRYKTVRLGTATSYAIPYVGMTISLTVGTLVADETVLTWHTTAPRWDVSGLAGGKAALVSQQKAKDARSWLVVGDLLVKQDADDVLTQVNGYETSNDRFVGAQCQLRDRLPYATLSHSQVRMIGTPAVTFAEVGGTGDTITRGAGSFVTDGFHNGCWIRITGTSSNNVSGVCPTVAASVLTLGTLDLQNEGPITTAVITAEATITFVDGGGSADTITRSAGSWLDDGFRTGDVITITGTSNNNYSATLTNVTATTLTVATGTVTAETIGSSSVTLVAGESKSDWVATLDAAFAAVDDQPRINLAVGRAWKLDPITYWEHPCPAAWADSIRSYQHDLHIATWEKDLGPLDGWSLNDAEDNLVQFDERVDGGALAARFTCLRTWGNGPEGTFVAMSLTRAVEGSVLQLECNMRPCNLAQSVCQSATENAIGRFLVLKADGTAKQSSLGKIEEQVNAALQNALLRNRGEGPRASLVKWTAATDDVLNVAEAKLHGTLDITFNGIIHSIETEVRINQGA